MRKSLIVGFMSLLVAGCFDKEISRIEGLPVTKTGDVHCTYHAPGYCMDCGLALDGKFDCGLKFKLSCAYDGTKKALIKIIPTTIIYESGKVKKFDNTLIIESLTACR